ncbi:hypothetical protein [uncultured Winogradskyella sp.]|uniref:hypothetical protein n=1 Tax=uncultured Winogradskyella sp. TaxID=395353 RepID=UPI002615B40A|nr:hypothetical protein [uncultured Winogradskyella sp.]
MKNIALYFIVSLFIGNCYAQSVNIDMATERGLMSKAASKKINAIGSPYINESFNPVRIKQFNDQIYTGRYNAYNDEMEIRLSDGKIVALDVNADYSLIFTQTNKTYVTTNFPNKNGTSRRGFLVLVDDSERHNLYKKEFIKYYDKVLAASTYQQDKPASFKRESDTFYLELNGETKLVPQKKKDLIKVFPEHGSNIKSFIKKNKLNPKNEEDLIKIVDYLSTL